MVIWNLIIVNNNHLVFKKEKPVGPTNFITRTVRKCTDGPRKIWQRTRDTHEEHDNGCMRQLFRFTGRGGTSPEQHANAA